jgi:hypothetical protein
LSHAPDRITKQQAGAGLAATVDSGRDGCRWAASVVVPLVVPVGSVVVSVVVPLVVPVVSVVVLPELPDAGATLMATVFSIGGGEQCAVPVGHHPLIQARDRASLAVCLKSPGTNGVDLRRPAPRRRGACGSQQRELAAKRGSWPNANAGRRSRRPTRGGRGNP